MNNTKSAKRTITKRTKRTKIKSIGNTNSKNRINKLKLLFLYISCHFIFLPQSIAKTCSSEDQAQSECCEIVKSKNHTMVSRIQTYDKSICTLSVYNKNSDTSFRRFGFGSDGQVSVFMQPNGNKQKTNASMSFLIFPFDKTPTVDFNGDNKLQVRSGSNQKWSFNTQTGLPTALDGCQLSVSSKFSLQESGIKIQSCKKHLVIETPTEVGGEYIAYPDKKLVIRDPNQNTCEIKNSDLYNYKKSKGQYKDRLGRYFDVKFKFSTNAELAKALRNSCPKLDLSMLFGAEATAESTVDSAAGSRVRKVDPAEEKRARDILEGRVQN